MSCSKTHEADFHSVPWFVSLEFIVRRGVPLFGPSAGVLGTRTHGVHSTSYPPKCKPYTPLPQEFPGANSNGRVDVVAAVNHESHPDFRAGLGCSRCSGAAGARASFWAAFLPAVDVRNVDHALNHRARARDGDEHGDVGGDVRGGM